MRYALFPFLVFSGPGRRFLVSRFPSKIFTRFIFIYTLEYPNTHHPHPCTRTCSLVLQRHIHYAVSSPTLHSLPRIALQFALSFQPIIVINHRHRHPSSWLRLSHTIIRTRTRTVQQISTFFSSFSWSCCESSYPFHALNPSIFFLSKLCNRGGNDVSNTSDYVSQKLLTVLA
jgi:hypothetical protein